MQGVILAAGRGTRMGALTEHVPKPMLPLLGKPLLAWQLEMLPQAINEVILVVGYLQEQIRMYFGEEWQGRKISYVVQTELNGTGGAIHLAKNMMVGPTLVMNGDDLYHPDDLSLLIREELAVLGLAVDHAQLFGLLEHNEAGHLKRITERPHGYEQGIVNTGAYILSPRFFEYPLVPISATEFGLPQTLAVMGREHPVTVLLAHAWQPVGQPEDITRGEIFLQKYGRV